MKPFSTGRQRHDALVFLLEEPIEFLLAQLVELPGLALLRTLDSLASENGLLAQCRDRSGILLRFHGCPEHLLLDRLTHHCDGGYQRVFRPEHSSALADGSGPQ
jgi:hypothetical protein